MAELAPSMRSIFTSSAYRAGSPDIITSVHDSLATKALPIVLSIIAGSTDTIGCLGLDGPFTAHITGNLVVLAAHL
jgi:hypothetical protein